MTVGGQDRINTTMYLIMGQLVCTTHAVLRREILTHILLIHILTTTTITHETSKDSTNISTRLKQWADSSVPAHVVKQLCCFHQRSGQIHSELTFVMNQ